ncbi:hypothetical protein ND486_17350 [Pseudonocardia sp. DR1-2]|uniref:hypothetical protein n=1 Tax=Pseudonocardia sp. DR1-2 TaxID=2951168 RepID=UPI0020446850|nr:hypothetical protein [Pseudonocardia sp. DR1-2]MCM3847959.1 hypothetical protein [Pseudonocardia sp. DR1-2]
MSHDLVVLGTDPSGDDASRTGAHDLLAEAGTVFAFPQAESTALFYAEAWRVEPVTPRDAVARIGAWAAAGPADAAVLLVGGDPAGDAALGAVLDGLARTAPTLRVRIAEGSRVAPPHRSPLIG